MPVGRSSATWEDVYLFQRDWGKEERLVICVELKAVPSLDGQVRCLVRLFDALDTDATRPLHWCQFLLSRSSHHSWPVTVLRHAWEVLVEYQRTPWMWGKYRRNQALMRKG